MTSLLVPRRQLRLSRGPKTDDELWLLIKAMWGIELPRVSVCEGHTSPFAALAHAYFARDPGFAVWYASRGSGKSLALAVLGATKNAVLDADVTILGWSMTQSQNVASHIKDLYEKGPHAPVHALKGGSIEKGITATQLTLASGRRIRPIPASQTTVRGPHPPLQLLDEVDEMDEAIFNASLGQAMEQTNIHGTKIGEYIVASSTWQNPIGTFTNLIDKARKEDLPIFTWCLVGGHTSVMTDRGEVDISQVTTQDQVWTRQGWKGVQHVTPMGYKPTIRIGLSNGRSLRGTADHLVAYGDGWMPLGALRVGDALVPSHARTTVPAAVTGGDVSVLGRELVPALAVGLSGLCGDVRHPASVFPDADHFEVVGVDARRVLADDMVQAGTGISTQQTPDGAMCQLLAQTDVTGKAPMPTMPTSTLPFPAPRVGNDCASLDVGKVEGDLGSQHRTGDGLLDADAAVAGLAPSGDGSAAFEAVCVVGVHAGVVAQVWDIGVEDAHEFVAEGIVVHNCWRELLEPHGWMSRAFIDRKRKAVSAEMWRCLPTDEPVQTRRGEVAIQDIKDGDEVWTRQGWRHVTALVRQNNRRVYTVTTDDGRSYRATANHKAATPQGWTETGSLRAGDLLVTADPPHGLSLARSAQPVPSAVDGGLKLSAMPVDADLTSVVEVALAGVVAPADGLQVSRLDAAGDVADVVHGHVVWQWSVPGQVSQPMGVVDAFDLADAVPVLGGRPGPDAAPAVCGLGSAEDVGLWVGCTDTCHVVSVSVSEDEVPTWDISVDGTHEFTVDGIVVHNTEYDLNEPSGSSRAFDLETIERYFEVYPTPVREEHAKDESDDEWTWNDPDPSGEYAVGADWAKESDKTVIAVVRIDIYPRRLVYLRRMNRRPYPVMLKAFDDARVRYNDAPGRHDGTGLGNVVHDFLKHDGSEAAKEVMVGRSRSQMFSAYITDFENGGYRLPRNVEMFYRAHRGATVADVFAPHKWNSHTPDDLVAMALVHKTAGRIPDVVGAGEVPASGIPRDVDKQFHVVPQVDGAYSTGDVTIVDERYDDVAVFNFDV